MVEASVPTFETFCAHQDPATLAADQEYIQRYEEVLKLYAAFASKETPTQINIIQPNPLGYSLGDMRLFHDFMTVSYPHLPLESDEAWLKEVPVIAQQVCHAVNTISARLTCTYIQVARILDAWNPGVRRCTSSF